MNKNRLSLLQKFLLIKLYEDNERREVNSLSEIAEKYGFKRESISRSLHQLNQKGFVIKWSNQWITIIDDTVIQQIKLDMQKEANLLRRKADHIERLFN